MKEAIGSRLNHISQESNEVLRAAAVLGKTFNFQDLMAITGSKHEDATLDALDEAVGAQLITAGSGDSFIFTHDKIRGVLYEELNPIRRRRLHRHAAEGLERSRKTSRDVLEKLAHHYIQAGDDERALYYNRQAAFEVQRLFPWEGAFERLDTLLDQLKTEQNNMT
jgi:predicted ATPase